MKTKRNSGFSMVEVVIALALIVLVTIAALTIATSSIATRVTLVNRTYAQNFADNVWECFKAADSEDNFVKLVKSAENIDDSSPYWTKSNTNDGVYEYTPENNNFDATITVNYAVDRPTFEIRVLDSKNKEVVHFEYVKGAN